MAGYPVSAETVQFNCPATGQLHRFTVPVEWCWKEDSITPTWSRYCVVRLRCEGCAEEVTRG